MKCEIRIVTGAGIECQFTVDGASGSPVTSAQVKRRKVKAANEISRYSEGSVIIQTAESSY
jgi:hypothetical protein